MDGCMFKFTTPKKTQHQWNLKMLMSPVKGDRWGFAKKVVPNNHGVFLLKMIILWCLGGTTILGNIHIYKLPIFGFLLGVWCHRTPPKFDSSSLKNGGWKTICLLKLIGADGPTKLFRAQPLNLWGVWAMVDLSKFHTVILCHELRRLRVDQQLSDETTPTNKKNIKGTKHIPTLTCA